MNGEYGALAERLTDIAEQLDQLAFDQLREAVADGEVERPKADKRLMQARRSIEKAAHVLRLLDDDEGLSRPTH